MVLHKKAGDYLDISFSVSDLLNQRNILNKFSDIRTANSLNEDIEPPELNISDFVHKQLNKLLQGVDLPAWANDNLREV